MIMCYGESLKWFKFDDICSWQAKQNIDVFD